MLGIKVVKFYAWEDAIRARILGIRQQELTLLRRLSLTIALGFLFVLLVAPIIMPILVFTTYVYVSSGYLSSSTAFTTLLLFNIIRVPFGLLPLALQQVCSTMNVTL
jgi:ATP-binding cassette subfamily C (CFTR/MRP) protein 1